MATQEAQKDGNDVPSRKDTYTDLRFESETFFDRPVVSIHPLSGDRFVVNLADGPYRKGRIEVYNAKTGNILTSIESSDYPNSHTEVIGVTPEDQIIAVEDFGWHTQVRVIDTNTQEMLVFTPFTDESSRFRDAQFCYEPTQNEMYVMRRSRHENDPWVMIEVYDVGTGGLHKASMKHVPHRLASLDGVLRDGQMVMSFPFQNGPVVVEAAIANAKDPNVFDKMVGYNGVCALPDGNVLVKTYDGPLYYWNPTTNATVSVDSGFRAGSGISAALISDTREGQRPIVAVSERIDDARGVVRVIDFERMKITATVEVSVPTKGHGFMDGYVVDTLRSAPRLAFDGRSLYVSVGSSVKKCSVKELPNYTLDASGTRGKKGRAKDVVKAEDYQMQRKAYLDRAKTPVDELQSPETQKDAYVSDIKQGLALLGVEDISELAGRSGGKDLEVFLALERRVRKLTELVETHPELINR